MDSPRRGAGGMETSSGEGWPRAEGTEEVAERMACVQTGSVRPEATEGCLARERHFAKSWGAADSGVVPLCAEGTCSAEVPLYRRILVPWTSQTVAGLEMP